MVKFYFRHFGHCSSIKDSVDTELLQLWFTHFILVKAYVGSNPTRATNFFEYFFKEISYDYIIELRNTYYIGSMHRRGLLGVKRGFLVCGYS